MGHIDKAIAKDIVVSVDKKFLDNTVETYTSKLNESNQFGFALEILMPQLVTIEYARNKAQVYLEPNDTLYVNFDAMNFQFSMKFEGKSAGNNIFIQEFKKRFPEETNRFKLRGYNKGIVHYELEEDLDTRMRQLNQVNFSKEMDREKMRKLDAIDFYQKTHGTLSKTFREYIWAEVQYDWAYKMMLYGYCYKNLHQITPDFYDFLYEVEMYNPKLLTNAKYRKFLAGFVNYKYDTSPNKKEPYAGQYEMSKSLLQDEVLFFFQADLIDRGFKKLDINTIIPIFNNFVEVNPYEEFDTKVLEAFQEANKYAVGSEAPMFTMKDIYGNQVSLNSYRGKLVYLDFWATWCRPCISKLETVKTVQRRLGSNDIVFIHLSLDRSPEKWKDQVNFRNLEGIHLFVEGGLDSEVIKAYNVRAIPEYFIIDRNGNFAPKPKHTDSIQLQKHLEDLLR